jgi:hypothetical protein
MKQGHGNGGLITTISGGDDLNVISRLEVPMPRVIYVTVSPSSIFPLNIIRPPETICSEPGGII